MLKIYEVNENYIEYLIPYAKHLFHNKKEEQSQKRKFIGILLIVNNLEYFAPLSSFKEKHRRMQNTIDFIKIYDIAVLNLNCMFPIPKGQYKYVNINKIADFKYRMLLQQEYRFITSKQDKIIKQSKELYKIATSNKESKLAKRCLDFKKLEELCKKFK